MHTAGGRVSIVIKGRSYSGRGEITIEPSSVEITAEANQDGSVYKTVKPKPFKAAMTFDRFMTPTGEYLKWDAALMLEEFAANFIEDDTNLTHIFTKAGFTGNPSINLATGEVSGVEIAGSGYTRT